MSPSSSVGPRLWRSLELAKPWLASSTAQWSPREVLASIASSSLTVKQQPRRFFMYEEHASSKLTSTDFGGGPTKILQKSPAQLADLLHMNDNNHTTPAIEGDNDSEGHYYYWTSPIHDVAPHLLQKLPGYENLHGNNNEARARLDPRGPSLWMGSNGSATQAHYDVADNVIVQLWGCKRIRLWGPTAVTSLHVFPDAHSRARKSQVNLDAPDLARYPQFLSLPSPVLDCVLQPGDALSIPAFWFHHVENGMTFAEKEQLSTSNEPSVSFNMFSLSESMMVAQDVFQAGSRPFGTLPHNTDITTVAVLLRALAWSLCSQLDLDPHALIRTSLLDTKYVPLHQQQENCSSQPPPPPPPPQQKQEDKRGRKLTKSEHKQATICMRRILPPFQWLQNNADDGVVSLVICHLLELWAVEMVGADSVEAVWEAVLRLPSPS